MAYIKKDTKTKKWLARVSWREGNVRKQKSKSGFRTQALANAWAVEIENKVNNGTMIPTSEIVFADYYKEWFETYKEPKLANQTKNRYKIIEKVIDKNFGRKEISEITRKDYQHFINLFGKNHAKSTVSKTHSIIKSCVKSAVLDDIISKNFTEGTVVTFNAEKKIDVEYLNLSEIKELISYLVEGRDIHFTSRYMILTAIYTGMRLGEIQALTWKDLSRNWKTISVNKAWDYTQGGGFKETKNESSKRIIRVNEEIMNWLFELKANGSNMVFTNQYDTIPSSSAVNKTLKSILNELGINRKNFHFHSLRHSHVAYLLSEGADIYSISKRLGHSDLATTTRTYAYLLDEFKVKQDNAFEKYLNNLTIQEPEEKSAFNK